MRPSTFNPWTWRDPSALAGGYDQTDPTEAPEKRRDEGADGPDAPGPGTAPPYSPAFDPDAPDRPDYRQQVGSYHEESYRQG